MRPLLREHILMDNERNQRLQKLPLSLQKNCPSLYIVCTGDLPAFFSDEKKDLWACSFQAIAIIRQ